MLLSNINLIEVYEVMRKFVLNKVFGCDGIFLLVVKELMDVLCFFFSILINYVLILIKIL